MKYILSIDQGTTGSRVVVYDRDGQTIAVAYRELPQHFPAPGWVEHNPQEIWAGVNDAIQEVLEQVPGASIAAIGIANQRETTIVWDRQTGRPVHNAIVWQCRRTADRCEMLRQQGKAELIRKRTGLPVDAYFSATKIEWILNNVEGAMSKAQKGELCFGTTDAWVLWKLTGGASHATDYTNASRTMLFNIDTLQWDKEILEMFSIPESMLPQVKCSSGVFSETVKCGRLPGGIAIAGIAGDQQASLFGQMCVEPGTIKNTYGTGCFVLLNAGKKRPVSEHGLITTLACGPSGEPVYALEGAIFVAGSAIQWLRDGLKILETASDSESLATSVQDSAGVYFVPALVGLGAPYWDSDVRGSLYGITLGTQKNHIVRAALEAIGYQTRDVLEAMQKDSGLNYTELKIDGGAAANNFLCQFQSDILGIEVIRPDNIETTSCGAAYLAGLAVGYWNDAAELKTCWKKDRVFSPAMSTSEADRLYAGWLKAIQKTLSD